MKRMGEWLRAAAIFCTLAGVAAPAQAATYDVVKQRGRIGNDGSQNTFLTGLVNRPENGHQVAKVAVAGSYHLKKRLAGSNDAYEDFIAFCIEVTEPISLHPSRPVIYTESKRRLDPQRRQLIATLLGSVFDPALRNGHHAAVQLAVWKLAYGDVSTPDGDGFNIYTRSYGNVAGDGFFSVPQFWNGRTPPRSFKHHAGVIWRANQYLKKLDGRGNDDWALLPAHRLTVLTAPGNQDLVTYSAASVPLPAGGALLAGGLCALGLRRIRRCR